MSIILVTGVTGFLGRAIAIMLIRQGYSVVGTGRLTPPFLTGFDNFEYVKVDISDLEGMKEICMAKQPDVIVHCAGIAHQNKFKTIPETAYDRVNHQAAVNLARIAGMVNPNSFFIFLSSICVYGENCSGILNEKGKCNPADAYAKSKFGAESDLNSLFEGGGIRKLDILRLAPVYSLSWRLNLEKRICGPGKLFYLKYGSGRQKLSILSRRNLIDFIRFRIQTDDREQTCSVINVSDFAPSSFAQMIGIINSGFIWRKKPVLTIPLKMVKLLIRIAQFSCPGKRAWIHSCYLKLSQDWVISNQRMLMTGFKPEHTLASVFNSEQE